MTPTAYLIASRERQRAEARIAMRVAFWYILLLLLASVLVVVV